MFSQLILNRSMKNIRTKWFNDKRCLFYDDHTDKPEYIVWFFLNFICIDGTKSRLFFMLLKKEKWIITTWASPHTYPVKCDLLLHGYCLNCFKDNLMENRKSSFANPCWHSVYPIRIPCKDNIFKSNMCLLWIWCWQHVSKKRLGKVMECSKNERR